MLEQKYLSKHNLKYTIVKKGILKNSGSNKSYWKSLGVVFVLVFLEMHEKMNPIRLKVNVSRDKVIKSM